MGQVKTLLAEYVPPDPQKMGTSLQGRECFVESESWAQTVALEFRNYGQPGDQMTLSCTATRKVSSRSVSTHMDDPKNAVTLGLKWVACQMEQTTSSRRFLPRPRKSFR